uniref:Secreted protein n=1 Tax=Rhipicephalus appendiculatus TaxID=34631 RepID=A0A131YDV5_RHIAP
MKSGCLACSALHFLSLQHVQLTSAENFLCGIVRFQCVHFRYNVPICNAHGTLTLSSSIHRLQRQQSVTAREGTHIKKKTIKMIQSPMVKVMPSLSLC